jgi:hypothetical protein
MFNSYPLGEPVRQLDAHRLSNPNSAIFAASSICLSDPSVENHFKPHREDETG